MKKFSYSELGTYLDCQVKWYITYVLGYRGTSPDLEFGAMAHKVLETGVIPSEELYPEMKEYFNISSWKNYFTIILNELEDLLKGYDVLYKEYKFDDGIIHGIIDLVLQHKETKKILLIDYKFTKNDKDYESLLLDQQLYMYTVGFLTQNKSYTINDVGVGYISIPKVDFEEPKILQKGGLSKSKDQRVLYKAYLDKLIELNLDVSEYEDILTILKEKSILNIVQKAQINIEMLERIGNNIDNTIKDMQKGYVLEKYPCRSYQCPCQEFLKTNPEIVIPKDYFKKKGEINEL